MRNTALIPRQISFIPQNKQVSVVIPVPIPLPPLQHPSVTHLRSLLDPAFHLSSGRELIESLRKKRREETISTLTPLDRLFGGGIPRGKLVELTARRSTGRFALALATLSATTSSGEAAALIDLGDHLDPEQLALAGAEMERILWVRPKTNKQALLATEMLITTGFPLVILDLGLVSKGRRVDQASWIRVARAAESHGAALLVLSPFPLSGTAAEAVIAARQGRGVWQGRGKTPRLLTALSSELSLEKHRHQRPGGTTTLRLECEEAIPVKMKKPGTSLFSILPSAFCVLHSFFL